MGTKFGILRTGKPIDEAIKYIREYLERMDGLNPLTIDTRYSARDNVALLRFSYNNKQYEYTMKSQANCRLNLWAIALAIESKVRNHLRGFEPFETSISPYLRLTASQEAFEQASQITPEKANKGDLITYSQNKSD